MLACLYIQNPQGPHTKDQVESCEKSVIATNLHEMDIIGAEETRAYNESVRESDEQIRRGYESTRTACAPETRNKLLASDETCRVYEFQRTACAPETRDKTIASDDTCKFFTR
jgi:hypothetical protein